MIDVRHSIEEARRAYRMQFMQHRQMLVDFYEGNQHDRDEYLKEWGFKDMLLPLTSDGLTRKVIGRISNVYKQPPMRSIVGDNGDPIEDHGYNEFISDNPRFDQTMRTAERYQNLLHNVLLRVEYNPDRQMWWFYVETEYYPHFEENNVFCPVAYSIPFAQDHMKPGQRTEIVYMYISKEEIYFHDEHGQKVLHGAIVPREGMPNPYGVMPVIDFSPVTVESYWSLGEKTLVDQHRSILIAEMDLWYAQHMQAFDQPVARGVDEKDAENLQVGPGKTITLNDPDADMSLLGYNPKIVESTEAIERAIKRVESYYGIHSNTDEAGNALSGIALKIKNLELLERRQGDVLEYRPKEQEIYDVVKAISEHHGLYKFADGELKVDFAEIEFPEEQSVEQAGWDWKFKHGFASKADYLRSQNPDLSEEEAQKVLEKNAVDNRGSRGVFSGLLEEEQSANGVL